MKIFPAAILLLMVFACSNQQEQNLGGHWKAIEATEEGRPLEIELNDVSFQFFPADRTYAFESTLNYREAGHFSVRRQYLFTTDTLRSGASEKAVEIVKLTPDSLQLRMQEAEKERLLTLVRSR